MGKISRGVLFASTARPPRAVHLLDVLTEVRVMAVPEIVVDMVAVGDMEVAMVVDIVTAQEAMAIEMAAMVAEATVAAAAAMKAVAVVEVVAAMSAMPSRRAAADLVPTVAIATMLPLLAVPVVVTRVVAAGTMAEAQDTQDLVTLRVRWFISWSSVIPDTEPVSIQAK